MYTPVQSTWWNTRARRFADSKPTPRPAKRQPRQYRNGMPFGAARNVYGALPAKARPAASTTDWSAVGGSGYEQLAALRFDAPTVAPASVPFDRQAAAKVLADKARAVQDRIPTWNLDGGTFNARIGWEGIKAQHRAQMGL